MPFELNEILWAIFYILLIIISGLFVLNRWFSDIYRLEQYQSKKHGWRSIDKHKAIPFNNFCSVCHNLMLESIGLFCEHCSLSACNKCSKKAEKKQSCRVISSPSNEIFMHNWVKVGSSCDDCNSAIGDISSNDYFCCWCQRIKHCNPGEFLKNEECDFGKMKKITIPPTHVKVTRTGRIIVTPPSWNDWKPLIIIGNPLSGGGTGEEMLSLFRGFLNPIQVIQLTKKNLRSLPNWIPSSAQIFVAGGDGSVSSVLTAISSLNSNALPPVGILPLGTGNDLSRVLGWGPNCSNSLSPMTFFENLNYTKSNLLDRWLVQIGRRQIFAYNYISIGVDARVTLDFHRARLHPLYVRGSQWINYMIYLSLGTQQVLSQDCLGLEKLLELTLDGNIITLPKIQSLLLLNIPSWGAGVDIWNIGACPSVPTQSYSDGLLEVIGINSSFHIAKLQIGLSEPIRIGQSSDIMIKLKGIAPMQADGEPWEQGPGEIHIRKSGNVFVLSNKKTK